MDPLILSGAMLVDGSGTEPVRGMAVVVEGTRIRAVVAEGAAPPGTLLRLDGLTLLPGLINCHVHLCLGGEADPLSPLREEPPALTAIKATVRARQTIEAGVTTVRDLGGREYCEFAVRRAIAEGLIPGPRIRAAGRGICMTGGHGWWFGREADGPHEVRKAVREQLKAGADVIKIFATGGVMTPGVEPGASQLTPDEIRAAIEEATKAGRRVAAHAQATQGIAHCVEAGITSIEHGIFLTEDLVARMKR
ncbi:MAG: amidohydrolase family protein, partial [Candidatus Rokubacteria bacterium]|nr:amidohydrolase family protein [Candidatus Rokubacteria bacterium]